MNNTTSVTLTNTGAISGTINVGAIPNNIYWTTSQDPNNWMANCAITTNSWEVEVFFD